MYQRLYNEIADESYQASRVRERTLLAKGISLLKAAETRGAGSPESFKATHFLRTLWGTFVLDLSNEDNALPVELRASLISIGLWVLKELDQIDAGRSTDFGAMIDVNQMIADGLQ